MLDDLSRGLPFLMEMKVDYKISTGNLSWIQWNSNRITGRSIYYFSFLMEMKVRKKISTAKKAKKIY